jgi:hypothetical protein
VELEFDADWSWLVPPPSWLQPHPESPPPVERWPCLMDWSVPFQFDALAVVVASLDWSTSPLFEPELRIAIGALTFAW